MLAQDVVVAAVVEDAGTGTIGACGDDHVSRGEADARQLSLRLDPSRSRAGVIGMDGSGLRSERIA